MRTGLWQRGWVGLALMAAALAACSTTPDGDRRAMDPIPNPHRKVGTPYVVEGQTYTPRPEPDYTAVGIASWYGPKFHNKLTANGELFDMDRLTAAHKTLPLPSLVRVTNLENGKTAILRLNDRGPFAGNRIIDLSRRAAEVLGTKDAGLGRVRVEYLGPARMEHAITALNQPEVMRRLTLAGGIDHDLAHEERPDAPPRVARGAITAPPAAEPDLPPPVTSPLTPMIAATQTSENPSPSSPTNSMLDWFYVQIGAFSTHSNALNAAERMPVVIPRHVVYRPEIGQGLYLARLGPYRHEFAALEAKKVARRAGFGDAHVVTAPAGD